MTDPTVGLWISENGEVGTPDPTNMYRFVGDNPVNAVDPTGLSIVLYQPTEPPHPRNTPGFYYVPDSEWKNRDAYLQRVYGKGRILKLPDIVAEIQTESFRDGPSQKALVNFLNAARRIWVMPAIPGLGYLFSDTFGSQCVRYTNALMSDIERWPAKTFLKYIYSNQATLRYPRTGGPEHSVILFKRRGDNHIWGLDNGFLGKSFHLFDPLKVMEDESLPQELRDDLKREYELMGDR